MLLVLWFLDGHPFPSVQGEHNLYRESLEQWMKESFHFGTTPGNSKLQTLGRNSDEDNFENTLSKKQILGEAALTAE